MCVGALCCMGALEWRRRYRKSPQRRFSPRSKKLRRVRGTFPLLLICVKDPDARQRPQSRSAQVALEAGLAP